MTNISNKSIVDCVTSGITRATDDHRKLTNGNSEMSWAPEYFLTVSIVNELRKLNDACIILEEPMKESQKQPKRMRGWSPRNRYDIVVRNSNLKPYAAIEVKNRVYEVSDRVIRDFERISTAVTPGNDGKKIFGMGIFAFYTIFNGQKNELIKLKKKISDLYSDLEKELKNTHKGNGKLDKSLIEPIPYTDEDGKMTLWEKEIAVWGGGCLILSP